VFLLELDYPSQSAFTLLKELQLRLIFGAVFSDDELAFRVFNDILNEFMGYKQGKERMQVFPAFKRILLVSAVFVEVHTFIITSPPNQFKWFILKVS
jgi:hypothetical protein